MEEKKVEQKVSMKKEFLKFGLGIIFTAGTSILIGSIIGKVCPTKNLNWVKKTVVVVTGTVIADVLADVATEKVMNTIGEIGEAIKGIGESMTSVAE